MHKIFAEEIWTKNWSGQWGLPFVSLYGDIYTKNIQELVGSGLKHNLILFEKGTSSNYLVKSELDAYCGELVNLIARDGLVAEKWAHILTSNADKIYAFKKELDARYQFTPQDYLKLQELLLTITGANFSIKKSIDYFSEEQKNQYLTLFTKARLYCEPIYNYAEELTARILKHVIGDKLSDKQIQTLVKEEVKEYFLNGHLPGVEALDFRYAGTAILFDATGKFIIYTGAEYEQVVAGIVNKLAGTSLKGSIAFKGIARGRVRVIFDPKNNTDFKEGDVLVTGMTRPEFLPLMKKSSALVTDAGGLLSHAAIVARELKKPCLIGTEVATKVFQDGDMVEVDAEKGIIKKI